MWDFFCKNKKSPCNGGGFGMDLYRFINNNQNSTKERGGLGLTFEYNEEERIN